MIVRRIERLIGPVGVDAALSRQRSPVRVRYESLATICRFRCGTPTAERPVLETGVCEFESRPHYSNGVHGVCRIARDPATVEDQVQFLAWTLWPASVMDSTTDFESVRRGSIPLWATSQSVDRWRNGIRTRFKTSRLRAWEFDSPLVYFAAWYANWDSGRV